MLGLLFKRLALTIPVFIGVTVVVFLMLHLAPGDPAEALLGPTRTAETLARARTEMGLDRPLYVQYASWIRDAARGDLGESYRLNRSVSPVVISRLGNSAIIASAAFVIAFVAGVTIGTASAVRRGSTFDSVLMSVTVLGISIPPFYMGMLLVLLFSVGLGWLPTGGMYPVRGEANFLSVIKHAILPSLALAAVPTTVIARIMRSSMLEIIGNDFIRTARAKGLTERMVINRHAVRNALVPVISVIGLQIGYLLSATALVEVVFSWPGLGSLLVQSITTRDLPLTQAAVLVLAVIYVIVNLLVDLVQARMDPRIDFS